MVIRLGNSCGSCIHSNRPKTPDTHAAHYEVAKTERWCFKHSCHITRESTCDDHEGVSRAAKTAFTKLVKYNQRLNRIREVMVLMGDKEVRIGDGTGSKTYYVSNNGLKYYYGTNKNYEHNLSSKESSTDRKLDEILKVILNKND